MGTETKLSKFAKYAWFALGYNVLVILWGVFLRASKSGDGCGQHWLTCHGEVLPSAPELKTVIEFSHRITSFLAFVVVLALLIWAFKKFEKGSSVRKAAVGSFIFVVTEALVGAGLVLTGNTADTLSAARPFWMAGHLVNTFILLAFLTMTAWYASVGKRFTFKVEGKYRAILAVCIAAIFYVGTTGSIAALASMLFPAETLSAGVQQDFSPTSNMLLRLRVLHPISSILTAVLLIFAAGWLRRESGDDKSVTRWSNVLSILVICQIAFGGATLLMLAPIVMQIGHLLLADAIWVSFVLIAANFLASKTAVSE
ncbi:MAG: COX15/CtaA family protein [Pyrinomonadaceae bacterium]|nr:COX15/CtaA family protein [Acidobacteriota bacterium]MBP7375292.1 COX15/CtaA family protein [Pyrinomonadaceae bacterium]